MKHQECNGNSDELHTCFEEKWSEGKLTQEERWQRQYDAVMHFMEANHRRPSKYKPEEKLLVHWLRRTTKLYNRGELPRERIARFERLMAIAANYRHKNQYE